MLGNPLERAEAALKMVQEASNVHVGCRRL